MQPLMFVLLFAYVFGGAIAVSGGSYREYVIAGILMQSLAFGMTGPATAIATDLTEGVIDRFRSLPASRAAYLLGHYLAELAGMVLSIVVLLGAGLVVGWRTHTDVGHVTGALAAPAAVRLGHDLDRHVDRPEGAVPRRGHGRRLRGGLPADVPEQHLRADRHAADRAAVRRRLEPGQRDGRRRPGAVRQPEPPGHRALVAARAPGAGRVRLLLRDAGHRGARRRCAATGPAPATDRGRRSPVGSPARPPGCCSSRPPSRRWPTTGRSAPSSSPVADARRRRRGCRATSSGSTSTGSTCAPTRRSSWDASAGRTRLLAFVHGDGPGADLVPPGRRRRPVPAARPAAVGPARPVRRRADPRRRRDLVRAVGGLAHAPPRRSAGRPSCSRSPTAHAVRPGARARWHRADRAGRASPRRRPPRATWPRSSPSRCGPTRRARCASPAGPRPSPPSAGTSRTRACAAGDTRVKAYWDPNRSGLD